MSVQEVVGSGPSLTQGAGGRPDVCSQWSTRDVDATQLGRVGETVIGFAASTSGRPPYAAACGPSQIVRTRRSKSIAAKQRHLQRGFLSDRGGNLADRGGCISDRRGYVSDRRSRSLDRRGRSRRSSRLEAVVSLDALHGANVAWEGDSEPLSCLFIGPVEEAEKAHLEALYTQARDSYYNGSPLIMDDMFDKVETRLRNLRSEIVLKYPRCSLRKFAAYSDAEEDTSQMSTLMVVWGALGIAGAFAAVVPPLCAATSMCQALVDEALEPLHSQGSPLTSFLVALGLLGGVPLASAAVRQVKSLMRGEVVALKGCCPNCGEEVYAFLDAKERKPRHKSECHVCEHPLLFQATVEMSKKDQKQWAYGRVYLVRRSKDLEPKKSDASLR